MKRLIVPAALAALVASSGMARANTAGLSERAQVALTHTFGWKAAEKPAPAPPPTPIVAKNDCGCSGGEDCTCAAGKCDCKKCPCVPGKCKPVSAPVTRAADCGCAYSGKCLCAPGQCSCAACASGKVTAPAAPTVEARKIDDAGCSRPDGEGWELTRLSDGLVHWSRIVTTTTTPSYPPTYRPTNVQAPTYYAPSFGGFSCSGGG